MRTRIARALLALALVFGLAACNSEPEPIPEPRKTTPAWMKNFDRDQLAEYDMALDRWTEYEKKLTPVRAEGKVTPEIKKIMREYWRTYGAGLAIVREGVRLGIRVVEPPEILWSRAADVEMFDSEATRATVTIEQCTAPYTAVIEDAKGARLKEGRKFPKAMLRTIKLSTGADTEGTYKIQSLNDAFSNTLVKKGNDFVLDKTPCEP